MLQSEILDVFYLRIAANLPPGFPDDLDPITGMPVRLYTSSTAPQNEDIVTTARIILTLLPATSAITTLGSDEVCRRRDHGGTVFAAVHTPVAPGGDILGIQYAQHIQALFQGRQQDAPLHYDNVTVRTTGRDGNAAYITNVVTLYRLESVN